MSNRWYPSTFTVLVGWTIVTGLAARAVGDCPTCSTASFADARFAGESPASYTSLMPLMAPPSYGYTGAPVQHCGLPAPQYPVPFPTPRPTVYTHLWYPPMMPHNSLPHYRGTYAFRHGPGMSRTTVMWTPRKLCNVFDWLHNQIELPR